MPASPVAGTALYSSREGRPAENQAEHSRKRTARCENGELLYLDPHRVTIEDFLTAVFQKGVTERADLGR